MHRIRATTLARSNSRQTAIGTRIDFEDGKLVVPDDPIIPFIEGDGTGPDIWRATQHVFDGARARRSTAASRSSHWFEVFAGDKAFSEATASTCRRRRSTRISDYRVSIKGPLTTPVGGGIRSLNVTLRQVLDLYACVRPVRYFEGVPSPVKEPEKVDMVIFRENTEDVYAGIEWQAGSDGREQDHRIPQRIERRGGSKIREGSAIGIKPISEFGSKRLVRMAIEYAIAAKRDSVTLVHKGNIMKFTEGAFKDWGYELAREEFGDVTIPEAEVGAARRRRAGSSSRTASPTRCSSRCCCGRRVLGHRHAEPQRRLPLRRAGRAGRRPRHGARLERIATSGRSSRRRTAPRRSTPSRT